MWFFIRLCLPGGISVVRTGLIAAGTQEPFYDSVSFTPVEEYFVLLDQLLIGYYIQPGARLKPGTRFVLESECRYHVMWPWSHVAVRYGTLL